MTTPKEIRQKINNLIAELYLLEHAKPNFEAGKTPIHYSGRVYDEKEIQSLVDSSLDFWLTLGPKGEEFERLLAKFVGTRFCTLVNSGSSANLIAFGALTSPLMKERRIAPRSEVITLAAGFPTTVNPIIQYNCVPVFVDIDPSTNNIDVNLLELALSDKTRAVMIAHTLGNPFDIDAVLNFCNKHHLFLIEDNCDALGSTYNGKRTGSFGHLSTCSFYPAHHITLGEGGAILTDDAVLKRALKSLRDWGRDCWCASGEENTCGKRFSGEFGTLPPGYDHKYIYSHIGYNLKPLDIQAAIGIEQIKKLPLFIEQRNANFQQFYQALRKYQKYFILPEPTANAVPSWFGFTLTVRENCGITRKQIVQFLECKKIQTRMLFGGNLLKQPHFSHLKNNHDYRIIGELKNTDHAMVNTFWFGVYPGLTQEHIQYIIHSFDEFFSNINLNSRAS